MQSYLKTESLDQKVPAASKISLSIGGFRVHSNPWHPPISCITSSL